MNDDGERDILFVIVQAISCFVTANSQILRKRRLAVALSQQYINIIPRGPYCKLSTSFLLATLQNGDVDLREDFRLTRRSFFKLINIVKSDKHHGWQIEVEVLLFLFWLASGCAYRVVTRSVGVPLVTVHDIVHRQLNAICQHLPLFIHFPGREEYDDIAQGFSQLAGTPAISHAVGAIDGTHVRVIPPSQHKEDYHNRKNQYSIQLQAVCNHEGFLTNIFTGYPGSVHDARIYTNSPLYRNQDFPPPGYYLLGDSAYPLSHSLLTPYKDPDAQLPVHARFNHHHSKARCIIERVFGQLKTRWRCIFTKDVELRCNCVPQVISACAAMHNLCHASGDILEVDEEGVDDDAGGRDDIPGGEIVEDREDAEGIGTRARLANLLSAPGNYPDHMHEHDYFTLNP